MRTLWSDSELRVVEPLGERLLDPTLRSKIEGALAKKGNIDEVLGLGNCDSGTLGIAMPRSEVKKMARHIKKSIQDALPLTDQGQYEESPDEFLVNYTVDVINGSHASRGPIDGGIVVADLNGEEFIKQLRTEMVKLQVEVEVSQNTIACSRELNHLEFHLAWDAPTPERAQVGAVRNILDGICLVYAGSQLVQIVDFRSAHEELMVHDGVRTPKSSQICRSVCRAIMHSGDNISDTGGEHHMQLNLDALPLDVTDLFFVLAAFGCDTLSAFPNPKAEIHDATHDRLLTEYTIESAGDSPAVIMCSISRDPDHGKWVMHGLGLPTQGGVKDYNPIRATIAHRQIGYQRWERRKLLVIFRILYRDGRITRNSSSEFASLIVGVLTLPVNVFQLLVTWH